VLGVTADQTPSQRMPRKRGRVAKGEPITLTLVGFGDWSGGSQSPISRQHAGPVQLIKEKIGRRLNVAIKAVSE
jgi:hypothetical protein